MSSALLSWRSWIVGGYQLTYSGFQRPQSLYPALHRLEEQGWISATWKASENNRQAKYYALTARGRKQMAEEKENWLRLSGAVARIVGTA